MLSRSTPGFGRVLLRKAGKLVRGLCASCCGTGQLFYRTSPCVADDPCGLVDIPVFVRTDTLCGPDIFTGRPIVPGDVFAFGGDPGSPPTNCRTVFAETVRRSQIPAGAIIIGDTSQVAVECVAACSQCISDPTLNQYYVGTPCPGTTGTPPLMPCPIINKVIACLGVDCVVFNAGYGCFQFTLSSPRITSTPYGPEIADDIDCADVRGLRLGNYTGWGCCDCAAIANCQTSVQQFPCGTGTTLGNVPKYTVRCCVAGEAVGYEVFGVWRVDIFKVPDCQSPTSNTYQEYRVPLQFVAFGQQAQGTYTEEGWEFDFDTFTYRRYKITRPELFTIRTNPYDLVLLGQTGNLSLLTDGLLGDRERRITDCHGCLLRFAAAGSDFWNGECLTGGAESLKFRHRSEGFVRVIPAANPNCVESCEGPAQFVAAPRLGPSDPIDGSPPNVGVFL